MSRLNRTDVESMENLKIYMLFIDKRSGSRIFVGGGAKPLGRGANIHISRKGA